MRRQFCRLAPPQSQPGRVHSAVGGLAGAVGAARAGRTVPAAGGPCGEQLASPRVRRGGHTLSCSVAGRSEALAHLLAGAGRSHRVSGQAQRTIIRSFALHNFVLEMQECT